MKQRNPIAVALLGFVTLGIYSIYWAVKTKGEMNKLGAPRIPTAWLIIVPLVNYWWYWKYSEGVAHVTNKKMDTIIAFILLILLGSIGEAIVQNSFNDVAPADASAAPPAPETPASLPPQPPVQTPPMPPVTTPQQTPPATPLVQ